MSKPRALAEWVLVARKDSELHRFHAFEQGEGAEVVEHSIYLARCRWFRAQGLEGVPAMEWTFDQDEARRFFSEKEARWFNADYGLEFVPMRRVVRVEGAM